MIDHVPKIALDIARMAAWLVILSAVFAPLERLFPLHRQKLFRRQAAVDIGYYFINGLVPGLILGAPMSIVAYLSHRLMPGIVVGTIAAWPMWARACAAMVVGEVGYYWAHRLSHEIPFLWRFHAVHHRAEEIDYLVSSRAHPVDFVWSRIGLLTPLFALGLVNPMRFTDGVIPAIVLLAGSFWGYFIHANLRWRLGPFEQLLATPGFHHWHHTHGLQRNCNYSTMLPWVDRIFGTLHLPTTWPARYGIPEPMPETLVGQLIQPLREPPAQPAAAEAPAAAQR